MPRAAKQNPYGPGIGCVRMGQSQDQRSDRRRIQPMRQFRQQNLAFAGDDLDHPNLRRMRPLQKAQHRKMRLRRSHAVQVEATRRLCPAGTEPLPGGAIEPGRRMVHVDRRGRRDRRRSGDGLGFDRNRGRLRLESQARPARQQSHLLCIFGP